MAPDDLLTAAEVAEMAGRHVFTVHRWASNGKLPVAQKLPGATGAYLFRRGDVESLLEPRLSPKRRSA
jgi:predicted site-specific integrase-resolvase